MSESPFSEGLVPGSTKLFVFFGGIAGLLGIPPFEFYRSASVLECSKIFVRDPRQAWYQRGLPGIGDDAQSVGKFLRTRIVHSGATDVRFVGNSMGGFAALLFCSMLRCGRVIAFAPQTFVSASQRLRYEDGRWADRVHSLHVTHVRSDVLELRPWIESQWPEMHAKILVSTSDALDVRHAEQLAGFPNIAVQRFAAAGHDLVVWLRDEGRLAEILDS